MAVVAVEMGDTVMQHDGGVHGITRFNLTMRFQQPSRQEKIGFFDRQDRVNNLHDAIA